VKISFYRIDYSKGRGELAGILEVKGGEGIVDTHDGKLKEFLSKPYTTIGGSMGGGGVISDSMVTYRPYSKEFLLAIETECWTKGYVSEREN